MSENTKDEGKELVVSRETQISNMTNIVDGLVISITKEAEDQLALMEETYDKKNIPEDLDDKKNYDKVHKAIQAIKKPRIALESSRKEVVAPFNAATKKVNGAATPLKSSYVELEEPWKKAKKDQDEKVAIAKSEAIRLEEERVDAINAKIAEVRAIPATMSGKTSVEIKAEITRLEAEEFDYQEADEKAVTIREQTLTTLSAGVVQAETNEENARKVAEFEEKQAAEQKERDLQEKERIAADKKKNAEQKAKMDEQQAKMNAQQKLIDDQKAEIAASEKAKEKAEADKKRVEAEKESREARDKVAKEAKEKAEAEAKVKAAKEAKERHAALQSRKTETKEAFMALEFSEDQAVTLVRAIYSGDIPNVEWVK